VNVGATGGTAGVNTLNNIPAHTHAAGGSVTITLNATTSNATTGTPSATNVLAKARKGVMFPTIYYTGGTPGTMDIGQLTVTAPAASGTTGTTGSPVGQVAPYDSTPPVMDVNYIICYDGYYPARP
jgi:microcystin-dependent protein